MVKIVADSSCDISDVGRLADDVKLSFVPLKILVEDKEFVDDEKLNIEDLLDALAKTTSKSSTAWNMRMHLKWLMRYM